MAEQIPNPSPCLKLNLPPNKEGSGYYLTPFLITDAEAMYECQSLDSVNDNLLRVPKPYTINSAQFWLTSQIYTPEENPLHLSTVSERHSAFFAQQKELPLQAIRYEGKFVGACSLTPHKEVKEGKEKFYIEIGYYLHPDHHGRGVMFAAALRALEFARKEVGIERVYASADIANPASAKILERLAQKTAKGEITRGEFMIDWPENKIVKGREKNSLSKFWEWSI